MRTLTQIMIPAAFVLFSMGVLPQTMTSTEKTNHNAAVWSPAQLLERAQHLRQLAAKGDGSASETVDNFPHHYTMLAFRSRSGGGELHENFTDMFVILEGRGALITGGEVADAKTTAPSEVRGSAVKGGSRQEFKAGDVVHIPAGVPHQMLVPDGETVTYFVVKIG
jgi:mannose-6-phosphate isomerase-like protein (cupin superfamily)